ncbi:UNVERIFIED_CONTAM: hypothetical protein HDU68_001621 [Siphonaria sp. JEL0065]|nr:hypothetical protein HDU68_001621 [Siphonaria sp. JEL0065]
MARSASGFRNEYNDNDTHPHEQTELPPGIDRPSVTLSDYSLGGSSTSILVPSAGAKDRDNDIRKKLGRASFSSLDGPGASNNSSRDSLTIPGRKPSTSSPGPVRRYSCDNEYQPQSSKSRPRREFIEAAISDTSMSIGTSPDGSKASVKPSNEQLLSVNAKLIQQVELLMKQNQQLMSALEEKSGLSNVQAKGILDSVNKATSKSPSGPSDERSAFERNLRDFFYDQEEGSIDLEKIKSRSMSQRTTSKASIGTNNSNVSRRTTDKGSKSPNESLNSSPVAAILDAVPIKTPVLTPDCPSSDDFIAHMAASAPPLPVAKNLADGEKHSVFAKDPEDSGRKSVVDENGKKSGKWFKGFMKK